MNRIVEQMLRAFTSVNQDEWYVEKIINKRTKKNRIEYLVKWEGYPEWESTWEPLSNLNHAKEAVAEYESHASQ